MSIADKIERGVAARRRTEARSAEEIAQRQRHADQANDRETPGHLTARRAEADAQEARVTDQSRDRDGGTGRDTGMTLGERIEAEAQRRQARRTTNIEEGRAGRSR